MPIYEYSCKKCGEIFESFVLRKDQKITCIKCGHGDLIQRASASNAGHCDGHADGEACSCGCDSNCGTKGST